MSQQNDEIFAKFMVQLAKKMIEREDEQKAEREALKAVMVATSVSLISASQTNTVSSNAATINSLPPLLMATKGAIKRAFDGRPGQFVSDDEMAVIRAYINGEDVLTTILSQER